MTLILFFLSALLGTAFAATNGHWIYLLPLIALGFAVRAQLLHHLRTSP